MDDKPYSIQELKDLIREECEIPEGDPFPVTITKQISRFVLDSEMTYKEIGRCVYYYKEVKKKKIDPLYGIWFVSNIRAEAARYWADIEAKHAQRAENAKQFAVNDGNTVVFNVKEILKHKRKPHQLQPLQFDEEGVNDGHK